MNYLGWEESIKKFASKLGNFKSTFYSSKNINKFMIILVSKNQSAIKGPENSGNVCPTVWSWMYDSFKYVSTKTSKKFNRDRENAEDMHIASCEYCTS